MPIKGIDHTTCPKARITRSHWSLKEKSSYLLALFSTISNVAPEHVKQKLITGYDWCGRDIVGRDAVNRNGMMSL